MYLIICEIIIINDNKGLPNTELLIKVGNLNKPTGCFYTGQVNRKVS